MERGYTLYNLAHNLSPSEMFWALFNPNPNVRILKRQGYKAILRHYFYKSLRKFKLTDI